AVAGYGHEGAIHLLGDEVRSLLHGLIRREGALHEPTVRSYGTATLIEPVRSPPIQDEVVVPCDSAAAAVLKLPVIVVIVGEAQCVVIICARHSAPPSQSALKPQ